MKRLLILVVVVVAGLGAYYFARERRQVAEVPVAAAPAAPASMIGATLLDGLGDYHFPVTSKQPEVQRWFDQGLMLTYGFNHDAAERSFLRAAELDPSCAMCWWGAALVLGPHVNSAMDAANNDKAWSRLQKAQALAAGTTAREQEFIRALAARYAEKPDADRSALDAAYADASGVLARALPGDPDAATFFAEAMMDTQPWDYYDAELKPKGHTEQIVFVLEGVIARNPTHPGALHLYVHAVEASADPSRGVVAADRLRDLIPGSGHLVHMPAHIYSRVGRWHDAVLANQIAAKADDAYLEICRGNAQGLYPLGYVPHNHHFLWFAASMEGSSALASTAAAQTAAKTDLPELMRAPGFAGLQHYWMTPWFDRVRFGHWEDILKLPNPAPDLPYVTAIWHYAQGMAQLHERHLDEAQRHLDALAVLAADPAMEKLTVWDRYPLSHATQIAERTLRGELAAVNGDTRAALSALREAVAIEDRIPYDEPPGWHAPTRQTLGALLLAAGDAPAAEQAYREELQRNPHNGWSLYGLAQSLRAQRRGDEAKAAQQEFDAAWTQADVKLTSSRF